MSTQSDNILRILKVQLPGVMPKVLALALGETVTDLCRDGLGKDGPQDYAGEPANWLAADEWIDHHGTIVSGTLARLMAQVGKPYTNVELASVHNTIFVQGVTRARERMATTEEASNGFTRVMANLRYAVPAVRDPAIQQELFNTVDEFRRNVLQRDPPDPTKSATEWLSEEEYASYFRLLTAGTLYRLFMQSNKPWTDLKAAALQQQVYSDEVATTRADAGDDAADDPTDRLMSSIRADLPGAKDAVILQALFEVVDEACRHAHVWVEPVLVALTPGRQVFEVEVPGADIVRVAAIGHPTLGGCAQYGGNGRVYVTGEIDDEAAQEPLSVMSSLTPKITVDMGKPEEWIPADLWGPLHQMLMHGVLSKLMLKPGKPYSNTQLAQFHGQKHRRFLMQAKIDTRAAGITPATPTWRFPRFAR